MFIEDQRKQFDLFGDISILLKQNRFYNNIKMTQKKKIEKIVTTKITIIKSTIVISTLVKIENQNLI